MSLTDFQILNKLGEGSYSIVYKAKRLTDGLIYALKIVKIAALKDKEKQNALNEVRILASINHENVISYKQAFFDESSNSLCIVMEFADSGDMFQRITQFKQKGHFMDEKYIWKVVVQVVSGMKALHDLQILHRDLKSANVFLYRSGVTKLGDMNVSKVAKEGMQHTQTGTPYYASPEVWNDETYDFKSDMWSLGCVIYEMAALQPPFQAADMSGLFKKITTGRFPRLPRVFSSELNTLIGMLLQINPRDRPDCAQVLKLPFLTEKTGSQTSRIAAPETILLSTIYLPKNLIELPEILPEPNYTDRGETRVCLKSRANRESATKSLTRSRPNLTPSMRTKLKEFSISPGTSKRQIIRENYGAFKLPPMKYPSSSRHSSVKIFEPSTSNRVSTRIDDLVERLKVIRGTILRRGISQKW